MADKRGKIKTVYTDQDKDRLFGEVIELMKTGLPVSQSCAKVGITYATFVGWAFDGAGHPVRKKLYAEAKEIMHDRWADEVLSVADEVITFTDPQGVVRRDAAAVQQQRLRVDSRKWLLSKLRPGQYGEKVTQEITGKDGGPIAVANVDMKNLTDDELAKMKQLLLKASK